MLLTHLGFGIDFIRWIVSCITTVSFSVLINGVASPFFHVERGLRQGCPLSPLLFLLVVEGLSRSFWEAKRRGSLKGIEVSQQLFITHLLFVDDVLIFCSGSTRDATTIAEILERFSKATRMEINVGKSMLTPHMLNDEEIQVFYGFFPYKLEGLDDGLKYLGFVLKPNAYHQQD